MILHCLKICYHIILGGMFWFGIVWCGIVWHKMWLLWYGWCVIAEMVWCDIVWNGVVLFRSLCSMVWYSITYCVVWCGRCKLACLHYNHPSLCRRGALLLTFGPGINKAGINLKWQSFSCFLPPSFSRNENMTNIGQMFYLFDKLLSPLCQNKTSQDCETALTSQ